MTVCFAVSSKPFIKSKEERESMGTYNIAPSYEWAACLRVACERSFPLYQIPSMKWKDVLRSSNEVSFSFVLIKVRKSPSHS